MPPGHGPRRAVHRFEKGGIAALPDAPRPCRPAKLLGVEDHAAPAELLDASARTGTTWSTPALREWLRAERTVEISADWLSELLHRAGFRWKRTRDSVRHRAAPVLQQAARAQLKVVRQKANAAERDLIFLDETGFAPTMPTGYTWSRTGQRAVVPREDTRNRHVNTLGALIVGTDPELLWQHTPGKIDAAVLLEFVCSKVAGLPGGADALEPAADGLGAEAIPVWARPRPCTVVLDNASAHTANAFKGRRRQLSKIGVELFYYRRAARS